MRWGVLFGLLGRLLVFLGLSMVWPLLWSLYYGDDDIYALTGAIFITILCGFIMVKSTKIENEISFREGFAVVALGWVVAAVFGALPYMFYGTFTNFIDAFFESMSGFTTTGATVLTEIEAQPHGILFWRSLTHWLGGMGIIVLFIAILPQLGVGAVQLFKAEVPGPVPERIKPRIRDTAKVLWYIYVGISGIEVIALKVAGMTLYDALNHTFATMATGGFSTKMLSIGEFHSALIDGIITFFMLAAGANFSLYYFILKGEIKEVLRDSEFRTYLGLVVVAITFVTFNIYGHNYEHLDQAFRYAAFQVSSIITTTGFVTADFDTWPTFSKGILVALMFVGGCAGSTSGSIKVMRFLVLFKQGIRELKRLIHPRAIVALKVGDKAVDYPVLINVLQFFFIYIFIFLVSVIVMSGFGLDLISAFTSVAATLGNVGPGLGIVGPMYSYDAIPYLGKLVLAFLMLLGRLELYTVLVLFLPDFWRN